MDRLPKNFPQVDDSELKKLAASLAAKGEDRALRLFACWCARQLEPDRDAWVNWIGIAEKYANSEIDGALDDTPEYWWSRNTGLGAWSAGWRNAIPSAGVCLAAGATLSLDADTAATAAADWQRRYYILLALKRGDGLKKVKAADRLLASKQIKMLQKLAREYPKSDLPARKPKSRKAAGKPSKEKKSSSARKPGSSGGFAIRPAEGETDEEFAARGWEAISQMIRASYEEHPERYPNGLPEQYRKKPPGGKQ